MRLDYTKGGLQFFFVTLASAERQPVLSRLIAEGGRPELLDIGELARAALRAVHRVWPAVTVSDYVIMPDHLHFLLIVNYDCDKSIGPLFIAHRVADAVEMAVARGLERTGARAPVRSVVFARDCYIELSFDARQLKAIRHYIKLNPARALWKLRHPDLFLCHRATTPQPKTVAKLPLGGC
ncbi:MAG: hypothetical protein IJG18_06495 [Kiritimatiellae bacterium]|nr:hypothetical protein [Kiritimatiellia bacterium]